jgi:ribose 5-phosphate isomerase B
MSTNGISRAPVAAAPMRKFVVASDHAAIAAKSLVCKVLSDLDVAVDDMGPVNTDSVDYPDYAAALCHKVAAGDADMGILLCGSGIGMSIAANKIDGIRAALVHDVTTAALSRQHNDANVLCLGAGLLGDRLLAAIVEVWLATPFEGGRHTRRVDKMMALETQDGGASAPRNSRSENQ